MLDCDRNREYDCYELVLRLHLIYNESKSEYERRRLVNVNILQLRLVALMRSVEYKRESNLVNSP